MKFTKKTTLNFLIVVVLLILFISSWFVSESSFQTDASAIYKNPDSQNWLGTDSLGRDYLGRLVLSTRISLIVGLFGSSLALLISLFCVLLCMNSWLGKIIIRISDTISAIPHFLLVVIVQLALYESLHFLTADIKSTSVLIITLALTHWMNAFRVLRAETKKILSLPFIEAARALGASRRRIFLSHLLPHLSGTIFVLWGLLIPQFILSEGFMSFVGLGIQPPQTSWGVLIAQGWKSLSLNPILVLAPSFMIFLVSLGFYILFKNRHLSKD